MTFSSAANQFIQDKDYYGTGNFFTAQGLTPTIVTLTFKNSITAVGFQYQAAGLDLIVNGNDYSFSPTSFPNLKFAGVSDRTAFNTVTIQNQSGVDLDNLRFGQFTGPSAAPEPAAWAMMIIGLGVAGGMRRRAAAHSTQPVGKAI